MVPLIPLPVIECKDFNTSFSNAGTRTPFLHMYIKHVNDKLSTTARCNDVHLEICKIFGTCTLSIVFYTKESVIDKRFISPC